MNYMMFGRHIIDLDDIRMAFMDEREDVPYLNPKEQPEKFLDRIAILYKDHATGVLHFTKEEETRAAFSDIFVNLRTLNGPKQP